MDLDNSDMNGRMDPLVSTADDCHSVNLNCNGCQLPLTGNLKTCDSNGAVEAMTSLCRDECAQISSPVTLTLISSDIGLMKFETSVTPKFETLITPTLIKPKIESSITSKIETPVALETQTSVTSKPIYFDGLYCEKGGLKHEFESDITHADIAVLPGTEQIHLNDEFIDSLTRNLLDNALNRFDILFGGEAANGVALSDAVSKDDSILKMHSKLITGFDKEIDVESRRHPISDLNKGMTVGEALTRSMSVQEDLSALRYSPNSKISNVKNDLGNSMRRSKSHGFLTQKKLCPDIEEAFRSTLCELEYLALVDPLKGNLDIVSDVEEILATTVSKEPAEMTGFVRWDAERKLSLGVSAHSVELFSVGLSRTEVEVAHDCDENDILAHCDVPVLKTDPALIDQEASALFESAKNSCAQIPSKRDEDNSVSDVMVNDQAIVSPSNLKFDRCIANKWIGSTSDELTSTHDDRNSVRQLKSADLQYEHPVTDMYITALLVDRLNNDSEADDSTSVLPINKLLIAHDDNVTSHSADVKEVSLISDGVELQVNSGVLAPVTSYTETLPDRNELTSVVNEGGMPVQDELDGNSTWSAQLVGEQVNSSESSALLNTVTQLDHQIVKVLSPGNVQSQDTSDEPILSVPSSEPMVAGPILPPETIPELTDSSVANSIQPKSRSFEVTLPAPYNAPEYIEPIILLNDIPVASESKHDEGVQAVLSSAVEPRLNVDSVATHSGDVFASNLKTDALSDGGVSHGTLSNGEERIVLFESTHGIAQASNETNSGILEPICSPISPCQRLSSTNDVAPSTSSNINETNQSRAVSAGVGRESSTLQHSAKVRTHMPSDGSVSVGSTGSDGDLALADQILREVLHDDSSEAERHSSEVERRSSEVEWRSSELEWRSRSREKKMTAISVDRRRYNVFTFLDNDGESDEDEGGPDYVANGSRTLRATLTPPAASVTMETEERRDDDGVEEGRMEEGDGECEREGGEIACSNERVGEGKDVNDNSDDGASGAAAGIVRPSTLDPPSVKRKIVPNLDLLRTVDLDLTSPTSSVAPDFTDIDTKLSDDLDTPPDSPSDSAFNSEATWRADTLGSRSPVESIPEYTAREEYQDNRNWRIIEIAGRTYRIDMKAIEPYKKVLAHGGYYGNGLNAIIVFTACHLPERSMPNYQYIMDSLFLYVISTLELLVVEDYMIVYFHAATTRHKYPGMRWLKRCYDMIDHRLRKNLSGLIVVHPTLFLKTALMMTRPFVSSKFSAKMRYVKSLAELTHLIPTEYIFLPEEVLKVDRTLNPRVPSPTRKFVNH